VVDQSVPVQVSAQLPPVDPILAVDRGRPLQPLPVRVSAPLPAVDPVLAVDPGRPLQIGPDGQCPTFLSRYEGEVLVINLVPGVCDM
jgi:hypothetical protein